jgi:hypothetical protein
MNDWDDPRHVRAQGLKTNGQCLSQTDTLDYLRDTFKKEMKMEKRRKKLKRQGEPSKGLTENPIVSSPSAYHIPAGELKRQSSLIDTSTVCRSFLFQIMSYYSVY